MNSYLIKNYEEGNFLKNSSANLTKALEPLELGIEITTGIKLSTALATLTSIGIEILKSFSEVKSACTRRITRL